MYFEFGAIRCRHEPFPRIGFQITKEPNSTDDLPSKETEQTLIQWPPLSLIGAGFQLMIPSAKAGETGRRKIFNFRSCGNRNVRDYLNCSGGNSRPLRFFEVWRAALFLWKGGCVQPSRRRVCRRIRTEPRNWRAADNRARLARRCCRLKRVARPLTPR